MLLLEIGRMSDYDIFCFILVYKIWLNVTKISLNENGMIYLPKPKPVSDPFR